MKVAKWGNSLAVRLPAAVTNALRLKEIEIHVAGAREFGVARKPGREDFLNQLRAYRGRLPPDFKFDRAEANAGILFDANILIYLASDDATTKVRLNCINRP